MKIVFLQPRVSYYTGGGEKYCLDSIAELSKKGVETVLITLDPPTVKSTFFKKFLKDVNSNFK